MAQQSTQSRTLHSEDYIAAFLSGALGVLDKRTGGSEATPTFQYTQPDRATEVENPDSPTQRAFSVNDPVVIGGAAVVLAAVAFFAFR